MTPLLVCMLICSLVGSKHGGALVVSAADIDALLDLKKGFNDPPLLASWVRRSGDGGGGPHCSGWIGVACNNTMDGSFSVVKLSLPNCFQGGSIRPSIGSLPFLQFLDLSGNFLSGSIPPEITTLNRLAFLDLSNNNLSGGIPGDWGNLISLEVVNLRLNNLSGSIPNGVFKAPNLQRLRLENNNLSGEIPPEITSHGKLRYFAVVSNKLTGQIPLELGNVRSLRSIYAGFNELNGTLPDSIGSLPKLVHVELEHNQLNGMIPASWDNLVSTLHTLNLSINNLTGQVPVALSKNFSAASFASNPDLCGHPLTMCTSSPSMEPSSRPNKKPPSPPYKKSENTELKGRVIGGVVGGVVGAFAVFVFLLIVFLVKRSQTRRRDGSQVQNWFSPDIQADRRKGKFETYDEGISKYVYEDIVSHAGFFDTAHVVGKGRFATVYRSHFPDGTQLAVKVFKYSIAASTFEREIVMLASIKHRYLLPIKGYYSDPVEKAVIHEYLPRGTLYGLLHGNDVSSTSMHGKNANLNALPDWATRQRIAFGVAQALDYLHRGCNYHVVHKDVKSTNILLETNGLLPRLGDFGIFQLVSNKPPESNDVAETVGYTAPEVLVTKKYTEKSDVYSFGVVLLELITGKKPLCHVGDKTLELPTWVASLHREKRGREVMDPVAWKTCPFPEYLDRALNLALLCVSENPGFRPPMSEVASILEGLASNPSPLRSPDQQIMNPLLP